MRYWRKSHRQLRDLRMPNYEIDVRAKGFATPEAAHNLESNFPDTKTSWR